MALPAPRPRNSAATSEDALRLAAAQPLLLEAELAALSKRSAATRRAYLGCYRRLADHLAVGQGRVARVGDVDERALVGFYLARQAAGMGGATLRQEAVALRLLAGRLGVRFEVEAPREVREAPPTITPEQFERLSRMPSPERDGVALAARDRAILLVLGLGGLRGSELRGLRVGDFALRRRDGQAYALRVLGKGDKLRRVHLERQAAEAVVVWLRCHPLRDPASATVASDAPLFCTLGVRRSEQGRPLSHGAFFELVQRRMRQAGIGAAFCHPHQLRHYTATQLAQFAPLHEVARYLGHASVATTSIYTAHDDDAIEQAYQRQQAIRNATQAGRPVR